ncbi:MAG: hypothetical protein ACOYXT_01440 [Bacteroidota bacterium]
MQKYKLSKDVGGPIDKNKAKHWMKKFEDKHKDGVRAYFYGSDIIRKIIDHPEAVGMRIYFAYGDEDKFQTVLIGAREDGSNIWPEDTGKDGGNNAVVADTAFPCPPYCPPSQTE